MFWPPNDLSLGEAYVYDHFDIEGDIHAFVGLLKHLMKQKRGLWEQIRLGGRLWGLPSADLPQMGHPPACLRGRQRSPERDEQAISYHYDLSNDFFGLWLDERMVYTCAYFASREDDLHTAQLEKLDHVCRKLRLKPGERLLDIGCGWGGLVMHAAKHYGVEAHGITLSRRQSGVGKRPHPPGRARETVPRQVSRLPGHRRARRV
jgi:cyclopropane-fatty-acyl-phospholipid synthase